MVLLPTLHLGDRSLKKSGHPRFHIRVQGLLEFVRYFLNVLIAVELPSPRTLSASAESCEATIYKWPISVGSCNIEIHPLTRAAINLLHVSHEH